MKRGERGKQWVVADFETTGEDYYIRNGYTKVWLYGVANSEGEFIKYGDSIEDFMSYLKDNLCGYIVYFHNLKFDGNFIISYLLNNGFKFSEELKYKDNKGFSTLIGDMGQFYSIKINFKSNKQVVIYDSLKVLPFKVQKIAEDFGFEIQKLKIDYNDYTIDSQRIKYVSHDVCIVAKALKIIKAEGINKMTIASSAYNYYLTTIKNDDNLFPELKDEWLDEYRDAYRGGRSMVNPMYADKIVHNIKRFDINSMYPYIMHDMPLPYGAPISISTPGKYKFELYKVEIAFTLKKGHLPSLLKKESIILNDSYYTDTDGIETMYISNIDLDLVKRNYDIVFLKYVEMWGFHTSTMLFKEYVDYFYNLKMRTKGAQRIAYKLMLNSLYGKFGSNYISKHKIPTIEDGVVKYKDSVPQRLKKYYLPMAIAITSYAHLLLDNAIQITGVKYFVYCDTDSVHTLGTLPNDMIDNVQLGKFKLEAVEEKARYVRQKCYVYLEDGKINITCAGMSDEIKELAINQFKGDIFNIFTQGFKITGKLLPKVVQGGVILYETTFKIK